jgi:RHS repeat-associated protein
LSNALFSVTGTPLGTTSLEQFGYRAQFGYQTDTETGFQLLTERYYDSTTGRFLTRDPIGYGGGTNLYAYVANNTENSVDPDGLSNKDNWYGYSNKDFHKWFHRCWKEKGDADADKEAIEEAYKEWVKRGSPQGGECWGGKPQFSFCRDPLYNPARSRTMRPFAEEARLDAVSHQQMEQFWTKVLIGDIIVGTVLLAPEGTVPLIIRTLTPKGSGPVPVPIPVH